MKMLSPGSSGMTKKKHCNKNPASAGFYFTLSEVEGLFDLYKSVLANTDHGATCGHRVLG